MKRITVLKRQNEMSSSSSTSSSTSSSKDGISPPSDLELAHPPNRHAFQATTTRLEKEQEQPRRKDGISDWEAGFSLAKAIMGAGSFALPWAFSKMGYLAGPIVLVIFLGLSVHSLGLLADSARWLRNKTTTTDDTDDIDDINNNQHQHLGSSAEPSVSYVDVARATFGSTGAALAYVASIASSIGVCGSYLVFVAVNLQKLLVSSGLVRREHSADPDIDDELAYQFALFEERLFFVLIWLVVLPIVVLLSSDRDAKRFAKVSFWGDLSVVAGMLATVVAGVLAAVASGVSNNESNNNSSSTLAECVAIGSPKDMALAIGSIGYLFLVHFLVLPIESSMSGVADPFRSEGGGDGRNNPLDAKDEASCAPNHPKDRFQKVVVRTFVVCGSICGIFGIVGYFLFGKDTQQIVFLNVEGSIVMAIVQLLLCIDLMLTYPVVMRPSIRILEEHWKRLLLSKQNKKNEKEKAQHQHKREDKELQMVALVPSSGPAPETKTPFTSSHSKQRPAAGPSSAFALGASSNRGGGGSSTDTVLPPGSDNHYHEEAEESVVVLEDWNHVAVCVALGVVAAGAGSFVPAFGLLSGLVGGVSQTFLAFVLPPLMWAKQQKLQQQQQQQRQNQPFQLGSKETIGIWACFRSLPWRDKALVLFGLGLIGWTLQSARAELMITRDQINMED